MAENEKLTTDQVIAAIHTTRGMITLTAQRLGVAVNTVRRYVRNYQSVRDALQEERDRTVDIAELKLFDAINRGEPWSIALTLKTLGKERGYVEKQQVEHSGSIDVKKLSDEELEKIVGE